MANPEGEIISVSFRHLIALCIPEAVGGQEFVGFLKMIHIHGNCRQILRQIRRIGYDDAKSVRILYGSYLICLIRLIIYPEGDIIMAETEVGVSTV